MKVKLLVINDDKNVERVNRLYIEKYFRSLAILLLKKGLFAECFR